MGTFSKRMQAIRSKLAEIRLPKWHILEVDLTRGETDDQAKRKYQLKHDTEPDDSFIMMHLVDREIIEARKGKEDNETKIYN